MPKAAAPATTAEAPVDVRNQLREDILTSVLPAGQRLKFEALRDRYCVSMGTLRELLTQLASEGLVVAEANRGFTVAPVSVGDLLDITELRVDLECKALVSAIQAGGDEWEAGVIAAYHLLQKLEPELRRTGQPVPGMWEARHRQFHDALVAGCTSPWVLRFRQTLFDQARRYRSISMKHSTSPGRMDQHRLLMEAVLARDAETACMQAEAHIRNTTKTILESMPGYRKLGKDTAPRRKAGTEKSGRESS
jgi:DNA-binding GntR family transcriptional regulator